MKLSKLVILLLFTFGFLLSYSQNWDQIIKICASDRQAEDNFGFSVAISGDYAIVGAKYEDHDVVGGSNKIQAGSAYIFKNESGAWTQVQKIVASDRSAEDWFGNSVAISGDFIVVGAVLEDEDEFGANNLESAGSAYIFKNESGTWVEIQKIVATDRAANDYFGNSVAISGDYIVVGAYLEDENAVGGATMDNAGSAYIFYNNAGTWEQTQKIVASDRYNNDYFGYSVAIDGNYLIVGAYNEDENVSGGASLNASGSAYIFFNTAGTWNQIQKIVASDREELDNFGWSVAIHGSYAIVGAYSEDEDETGNNSLEEAGSAYIFFNNVGVWTETNKIVASDRENGDRFGHSVAIYGDYAVVGAYLEDEDENGLNSHDNAGSAYIFKNDAGNWVEEQKIVSTDRSLADWFGVSVAISDTYILVGAQLEDHDPNGETNLPSAGSAYVFQNCREINIRQNTTDIADGGEFSFGVIPFGDDSGEIIFTIENTGVDNLLLTGDPKIEISGVDAAAFNIDQISVSSPVLPGTSTTFSIVFEPGSVDLHTAEISISNNDNDENPYNFTINGSGGNLTQTISGFDAIPDKVYGDDPFVVSATASSGLDVIFTSSDENVATCTGTNGSTITIINAGNCQIFANQPGNAIYLPADEVPQSMTINVKPIDVTVNPGQLKVYGESDPVFTFSVDPILVSGDEFTGSLLREAGENVGYYEIQQGSLSAGTNYNITFYSNDFEISIKPVTVTVDEGQSKVYGETDPAYTYSVSPELVIGDNFTGVLSRVAGESVGFYEILQGTLGLSSNYNLIFVSNDFEITQKNITVTTNSNQTKIYGVGDPVFSYGYTPSLVLGDSFSGVLTREIGEDVGLYEIQQGTLDLGTNYNIIFVSADFEILQKPITVVAYNSQFKTYGQNDPAFIYYSIPSPISGDEFTGALSRVAGEDIGYYAIELGSLSLGPNYDMSLTSADFQIKIKPITVTVTAGQSKEYGDDDPEFAYTTSTAIAPWDSFTGALSRAPGEAVGSYPISQGTLALNSNYNLSFVGNNFTITVKQITVTADPNQTKVYGDDDPAAYTYSVEGTLAPGDDFSGALTRDVGENVGIYQIKKGSLALSSNYNLVYVGDYFHITAKGITVTANESQSKIYGESNPAYSYTVIGELETGDSFSGQLTREVGENIGLYEIQQGTLSLSINYSINYIPAEFEIFPKSITVTADSDQSKIYGENDPVFTYTVTGSLVSGDNFSGALLREEGEDVGLYEIHQGSLVLSNNYNLVYFGDDFEITPKAITVTADAGQNKIYGETDPIFTYSVNEELVNGDNFIGTLARVEGENAGLYGILQGGLALSNNFNLNYAGADFEILKANSQITWANPDDIFVGTELTEAQLNATADVDGTFDYNPDFGTVLPVGDNQALYVLFTPADITNYNTAEETVFINVLLDSNIPENDITANIYPNPTTGIILINNSTSYITDVIVTDLTGKLLLREDLSNGVISLDLSELPTGAYILQLNTNQGVVTEKIIKR